MSTVLPRNKNRIGCWMCKDINSNSGWGLAVVNQQGELYLKGPVFNTTNNKYSYDNKTWYKFPTVGKVVDFKFVGDSIDNIRYINDLGELRGIDSYKSANKPSSDNYRYLHIYSDIKDTKIQDNVTNFVDQDGGSDASMFFYIKDGKTYANYISSTSYYYQSQGSSSRSTYIGQVITSSSISYSDPSTNPPSKYYNYHSSIYNGISTRIFSNNSGGSCLLGYDKKIKSLNYNTSWSGSGGSYTYTPYTTSSGTGNLYDPVYIANNLNDDIADYSFIICNSYTISWFHGLILKTNGTLYAVNFTPNISNNTMNFTVNNSSYTNMLSDVIQITKCDGDRNTKHFALKENGDVYELDTRSNSVSFSFEKVSTLSNIASIVSYKNNHLFITNDNDIINIGGESVV